MRETAKEVKKVRVQITVEVVSDDEPWKEPRSENKVTFVIPAGAETVPELDVNPLIKIAHRQFTNKLVNILMDVKEPEAEEE